MKTKALISFAVTAKLICVFVFTFAYCWFSYMAVRIICSTSSQETGLLSEVMIFPNVWNTNRSANQGLNLLYCTGFQLESIMVLYCFSDDCSCVCGIFLCHHMHQSFVTMAPPPMGKGGDYDFSVFNALLYTPPPGDKLEVKTMLFALPFSI